LQLALRVCVCCSTTCATCVYVCVAVQLALRVCVCVATCATCVCCSTTCATCVLQYSLRYVCVCVCIAVILALLCVLQYSLRYVHVLQLAVHPALALEPCPCMCA